MAIQELSVFPQGTVSAGQGFVGVRRWALDGHDEVLSFINYVCQSHWPEMPNCIPVQVQWGSFTPETLIKCSGPHYTGNMGDLPQYGKYLVVAQYALHRMTNCWPALIPKPWHPPGTTLTLRTRGAGQALTISVAGMTPILTSLEKCNENIATAQELLNSGVAARIIVPVTEFHVTCDRMTLDQVNLALAPPDDGDPSFWDLADGSVNDRKFLGAPRGTLLMDGYEIADSFACDYFHPYRYSMSACFKQRIITANDGQPLKVNDEAVGWNHDFINVAGNKGWGWQCLTMRDYKNDCAFRYTFMDLRSLFGRGGTQECEPEDAAADGQVLTNALICSGPPPASHSQMPPSIDVSAGDNVEDSQE